jgi:sterol desaturase/sphingolipid hydroxylase (fatty acid hydroxylase superfamily)
MLDFNRIISGLPFFNPGSRIYYLSLIITCLLSVLFFLKIENFDFKIKNLIARMNRYLINPSTMVDYKIIFINTIIRFLFFTPLLGLSYLFSTFSLKFLYYSFGQVGHHQALPLYLFLATFFVFVFDDFLRFAHHVIMHKVPFLWTIHKTHHSATTLTPLSLYRIHPIESLIANIRNSLSLGVSSAILMWYFADQVSLMTLFGVNAFGFFANSLFGNLRHSHIPISFGLLEYIFISPKQHQIHHSINEIHYDKNFGVTLSVWDHFFGSFLASKNQKIEGFGLHDISSAALFDQFLRLK